MFKPPSTSSIKARRVDGFLLTGLPPFIIQTLGQVGFTAWRTREKRAQRVQQWPVLPVWRPSETTEAEEPLNWRHRVAKPWLGSAQNCWQFQVSACSQQALWQQTDKQPEKFNMSIDVIGDTVNDYLTLFDESRKGTVLLISSSYLPCGHGFNVLTDCTVLGDVLCPRKALQ